jgi:hypothetical protein
MKRLRALPYLVIVLALLLAACRSDADDRVLPTLVELPAGDESAAAEEPTRAAGGPTLPATWTPVPETDTPEPTPTITVTPSHTITNTPTRTATATPSATPEPNVLNSLVQLALEATVLPSEYQPQLATATPVTAPGASESVIATSPPGTTGCQYLPPGGFGQLVMADSSLLERLGCPVGTPPETVSRSSASQSFENGAMAWVSDSPAVIYVLYGDGTFRRVTDTFNPDSDPESGGENPPAGRVEPVRGFGKVWRTMDDVRGRLGWATAEESGATAVIQDFVRGRMLYLPSRGDILVLFYEGDASAGRWQAVAGQF